MRVKSLFTGPTRAIAKFGFPLFGLFTVDLSRDTVCLHTSDKGTGLEKDLE